jgi:hypothetical protein
MPRIKWTPERDAWFVAFVPGHTEREISAEHNRVFGVPLTGAQIGNAKTRLGVKSGTTGGRFEKGQVPANKGKTWDEQGISAEVQARMRATQYKKGNLPMNAHQPIGTERVGRDGYVWVKVAMRKTDPKSAHDNWVCKHRMVWEQANGRPVPDGCIVVFLDGDRTNFDPANLAIETKGEHAVIARNHIPFHDAASHEVARAVARMKSAKFAATKRMKGDTCMKCARARNRAAREEA